MDTFHRKGRSARLLGDQPILFFNDGARGSIAVEAAEHSARHSAIGTLRTIFVDHVEQGEFSSRCRLSGHCQSPAVVQRWMGRNTSGHCKIASEFNVVPGSARAGK